LPTLVLGRGGFGTRIVLESGVAAGALLALLLRRIPRRKTVISLCPSILMVAAGLLARKRGGTHVAILHDIQSGLAACLGMVRFAGIARLMRLAERIVLDRVDHVVVLTDAMRDVLVGMGVRRPIHVLPIWVDPEEIVPLPKIGSKLQVQYSGNLGRKQGLDQVLDLAARLLVSSPEVEVLIRGRGSLLPHIVERAERERLTNVTVTDLVPSDQVSHALAEGDVHVVPQAASGASFATPSKVVSILAARRPVVCTALPGTPLHALAAASAGAVCVAPGDIDHLHDETLALLRDPARRQALGTAGRRFVIEHLTRDVVLARLVQLLPLSSPVKQPASEGTTATPARRSV
jgi:colanic acid biosynthesis glycosyl transferase WcaI